MLIQSLYACQTPGDIELLVTEQPTPAIFFKVFLELDIKSMVAYLSFDSASTRSLLDEKHNQYFEENDFDNKFPVFFKNRDQKSAIDVALGNNQIRSVNAMVKYITKYQNSFVFAHLFYTNFVELMQK